jgi:hypothetical protein
MNVALWLVAGVLAAAFADTGSLKLRQSNQALSACGMTWTEDFSPATVKFISRPCCTSHRRWCRWPRPRWRW